MLEPGREMDALIAERVIGEPFIDPMYKYFGEPECCPHCGRYCGYDCHYSTDDDAAWRVVRAMMEKGIGRVSIQQMVIDGSWEVIFGLSCRSNRGLGCENSFPHAVCLAALMALGVEV